MPAIRDLAAGRIPKVLVEVVALRQPRPRPPGGQGRCAVRAAPERRGDAPARRPLEIGHLELNSFLFCGPTGCNARTVYACGMANLQGTPQRGVRYLLQ